MSALLGLGLLVGGDAALDEMRSSRYQAEWLSGRAKQLSFGLQPGPSALIRFPGDGPFDQRLGYHQLPALSERLQGRGFALTAQARISPEMARMADAGLFASYPEKTQAGLELLDCQGQGLSSARFPERVYAGFEVVPSLLIKALLFIENRELLDPRYPLRNPAVEWDRFGKAAADQLLRRIDESHRAAGGSTLATQIEKYRHSPDGRTDSAQEKLRQMASASQRAYLGGPDTRAARQRLVLDYLNTVPLSAQAGFGEVNGIGDGLWAWYGRDFQDLNRLLTEAADGRVSAAQALAFKQALSLLIAQRRPSYYLADSEGAATLRQLTDSYLRVLAEAGALAPAWRDAALPLPLDLQRRLLAPRAKAFVERKAATVLRGKLQGLLGLPRAYDLDRLDLQAVSTLDGDLQARASALLRGLSEPKAAKAAGLYGFRLLNEGDDPSKITFSFTLYERGAHANLLRVQTDNVDQPFDLNEGARLDLGSTAKLRTLVTYLELVSELHQRWAALPAEQLAGLSLSSRDALSRWARDHLAQASDKSLAAMLEAAMLRSYSASPQEGFFTGGGRHHFANFEPEDNGRTMTVREALTRSVNLVFIRLLRDVVQHLGAKNEGDNAELLSDPNHPRRQDYLARFADKEGREFLARFHQKHAGKSTEQMETEMLRGVRPTPARLAASFYGLQPDADGAALAAFFGRHLPGYAPTPAALQALQDKYGAGRWSLPDRGYLAGLHPLELWVVAHLRSHPGAKLAELIKASPAERQEVYGWLFKTRHKSAQDGRIRNLLELEAFVEIHRRWQRLGYPFAALTPSYASALGASGDRPAALAELMGIIVNGGLRLPVSRVSELAFARATPFETHFSARPPPAARVLDAEVAALLRSSLIGVVEDGTAKRLKGLLKRSDGSGLEIGGKTGTGDQRFDTYGRGGQLLSSRVVKRSATLVFLIGERYFGTMMAYVQEPYAANYKFTSAMPTQLLKTLTPALLPLLEGERCRAPEVAAKSGAH